MPPLVRKAIEFGLRDIAVGARIVPEVIEPDHRPNSADAAQHPKGGAPGEGRDEDGDDRRGHGVTEAREGMSETLHEAALGFGRPVADRARRGGQRGTLSDSEHHAHENQGGEAADEAGQGRRYRPDQGAKRKRDARPETVAQPSPDDLEYGITPGECRERNAELGIGETKLLLNGAGRGREIHPIDIEDETHRTQNEYDPAGCFAFDQRRLPVIVAYLYRSGAVVVPASVRWAMSLSMLAARARFWRNSRRLSERDRRPIR